MRIYSTKNLGIVVMSNSTGSYRFQPVFTHLAGITRP